MPVAFTNLSSLNSADSAQIQFTASDIVTNVSAFDSSQPISSNNLKIQAGVTKTRAAISLPAPPTMSFRFGAEWEMVNLGFFGARLASMGSAELLKDITNLVTGNVTPLAKDVMKSVGDYAADILLNIAKNTEGFEGVSVGTRLAIGTKETTKQLFRQMKPRSFSFSFTLSPKNQKEAEDIKSACKIFRYYMHPFNAVDIDQVFKIVNYPAVWDIKYLNCYAFRGTDSYHIPNINQCVLVEYNETYGTDRTGFTVLSPDGYPVQTKIDLTFNELKLLDRTDVYWDGMTIMNQGQALTSN